MTPNDLKLKKTAKIWLYAYQTKASNPGNVKTDVVYIIDLQVTSNDPNDLKTENWKTTTLCISNEI